MRPGAYKAPLVKAIYSKDQLLADKIEKGEIVLAVKASLVGNGTSYPELSDTFVRALESVKDEYPEEAAHYIAKLQEGSVIAIDPTPPRSGKSHYAPGELFFTT
jgi:hypothetical protein